MGKALYINIKDFHPYLLRLSHVLLQLGVDGGVAAAVLLLGPLLTVPHAPLGVFSDLIGSPKTHFWVPFCKFFSMI